MNNIIGDFIMGIVRHSLTTILGGFVAKGLLTGDQEMAAVSAIATLIPIGMSLYSKLQAAQKLANAKVMPT